MMNNTLAQWRDLKLAGMASAIGEQLSSAASTGLSFEERDALGERAGRPSCSDSRPTPGKNISAFLARA